MTTGLAATVRAMFDAFDKLDFDAAMQTLTEDAQGVDEISRHWMRGSGAIAGYFDQLGPALSDVHSSLSDTHESEWGDTGVVTAWLEQDYLLDGDRVHVSAPVTVVLRRSGKEWRLALLHAIPMPEENA